MSVAALVPLVLMPFFGTRVLAGAVVFAGLVYVAVAHLLARGPTPGAMGPAGAGRAASRGVRLSPRAAYPAADAPPDRGVHPA